MKSKPKDPASDSFPYSIPTRLNLLSHPRSYVFCETWDYMPAFTPYGVRVSALGARISDRVLEQSYPPLRRLFGTKYRYKKMFTPERLEVLDRYIHASNATTYAKLSNTVRDFKKLELLKKKKPWSDSDWKKHMDRINAIAGPRKIPDPWTPDRGPQKPIEELLPRMYRLMSKPSHKLYKPLSQDSMYKDPTKVSPAAKLYVITERTKQLAEPRKYTEE